jgi:thiosulfate dehydrogenase [quinone] large subunit
MWTVVLPPENNPVIDDHILAALTLVVLAMFGAGNTWGLGRWWGRTGVVGKYPVLK